MSGPVSFQHGVLGLEGSRLVVPECPHVLGRQCLALLQCVNVEVVRMC